MALESWYDCNDPEVTIVVVSHNNSDLTLDCLRTLWNYTFGYRYEIVLVDNGSSPENLQKLIAAEKHFRLVRLPSNRPYGDACNFGVGEAKGSYIIFLNNDAFVTSDWLAPLISVLRERDDVGAIGARLINSDGTLQEAGAFVHESGSSLQVGGVDVYHPGEEFELRIVDYCSAACLAVPKEMFTKVGGFDPVFFPAYYEDVDLCFRIAATGKFVVYCPASTVIHLKNFTAAQVWTSAELEKIVEANRVKFLSRWGGWLRSRANNQEISFPTMKSEGAPC